MFTFLPSENAKQTTNFGCFIHRANVVNIKTILTCQLQSYILMIKQVKVNGKEQTPKQDKLFMHKLGDKF